MVSNINKDPEINQINLDDPHVNMDKRWDSKSRKKILEKSLSLNDGSQGVVNMSLQFDKKLYKEFRRVLFKEGIWPQEYLKFAISSLAYNNPSAVELLKDLKDHKAQDILKGGKNTKVKKIHAENIYDMIELEINKTQNSSSVDNLDINDSAYRKS